MRRFGVVVGFSLLSECCGNPRNAIQRTPFDGCVGGQTLLLPVKKHPKISSEKIPMKNSKKHPKTMVLLQGTVWLMQNSNGLIGLMDVTRSAVEAWIVAHRPGS